MFSNLDLTHLVIFLYVIDKHKLFIQWIYCIHFFSTFNFLEFWIKHLLSMLIFQGKITLFITIWSYHDSSLLPFSVYIFASFQYESYLFIILLVSPYWRCFWILWNYLFIFCFFYWLNGLKQNCKKWLDARREPKC